jgi:hypothetical protein
MARPPRNIRSRSPRPISSRNPSVRRRRRAAAATASHGWRRGRSSDPGLTRGRVEEMTPTPPPIVVSREPAPASLEPDEAPVTEPAAPSPRARRLLLAFAAMVIVSSAWGFRHLRSTGQLPWSHLVASMQATHTQASPSDRQTAQAVPAPAKSSSAPSSGWTITQEGHIPIAGGVMFTPKTFKPEADGSYDLVLHFHGNANIVLESMEYAGVNAVVAVINWGISSKPYRNEYRQTGEFEKLLAEIDAGVKKKGVETPKLRRLALTSWSAGFGAIESILEHRNSPAVGQDYLDAIIAIDGVHAAYMDGDPKVLRKRTVLAWVNAARAAARGGVMLSMTHSQIEPPGFASARRTQAYVLDQLKGERVSPPVLKPPRHLSLDSAKIAVAQGKEKRMVPTMDVRMGNLRVQGFEGVTKEHHIAHLTQMAAVVLPDLVSRWAPKNEHPRVTAP